MGFLFDSLTSRFSKRECAKEQVFGFFLDEMELERVDGETRAAYEEAVSYLSYVRGDGQLRGLLGFPVAVSRRFVDLLDNRDPMALAVVGNWLALLRMSHLSKFLKGARERELDEIMQVLLQEWWLKMSWAMAVPAADLDVGG